MRVRHSSTWELWVCRYIYADLKVAGLSCIVHTPPISMHLVWMMRSQPKKNSVCGIQEMLVKRCDRITSSNDHHAGWWSLEITTIIIHSTLSGFMFKCPLSPLSRWKHRVGQGNVVSYLPPMQPARKSIPFFLTLPGRERSKHLLALQLGLTDYFSLSRTGHYDRSSSPGWHPSMVLTMSRRQPPIHYALSRIFSLISYSY